MTTPLPNAFVAPMPVVIIHRNPAFYLDFSLRQARRSNPDSLVYLVSNERADLAPGIRNVAINELITAEHRQFAQAYRHASPNSPGYELFCFQRWFLLRELMRQQGHPMAMAIDSDLMLYAPLSELADRMQEGRYIAAYGIGADCDWVHSASGHVSCWTLAGIDSFCTFLLRLFTDPAVQTDWQAIYDNPLLNNDHVGISDMTALYLFYKRQSDRILNQSVEWRGQTFDHNINVATNHHLGEYETKRGFKWVHRFGNLQPVCFNTLTHRPVLMGALHFQGSAKNRMHRYYTGTDLRGKRLRCEVRLQAVLSYHHLRAGLTRGRAWIRLTVNGLRRLLWAVNSPALSG